MTEEKTNKVTGGSAAAYREALRQKPIETVMVPVPSGFKWELKPPDLQGYVMTGRLPQSLLTQFLTVAEKRGMTPEELTGNKVQEKLAEKPLSADEGVASLIFMRELVREACVNPRIVIGGSGPDELDPIEVDPDDFKFIVDWCLGHLGVAGVTGLQTFPPRPTGRAPGARTRRKKLRKSAVGAH
jgi:hypothetical protein